MRNQEWLATDEVVSDLAKRSARGGAFTAIAQAAKVVVELGATLLLARLLTPSDFGVVGMVIVVTGFITLFRDLGLSMATVQRETISQDEVSTLFWINAGIGLALTVLTALAAPVFALVYDVSAVRNIAWGVSIGFFLGSLGVQHQALLQRQLFLGRLSFIELVSIVGSFGLAMFGAWRGWGYYALVVRVVAAPLLLSLGAWLACSWRPSLPKRTDVRELLRFGGNLTGFSLVNYFARNLDDFLIGKYFGPRDLGIYQKGYELLMVPIRQLNAPVSSLAVPMLSRLVDQPERYKRTYLRLLEKILLITMPAAGWLMATSDWVVRVVLGSQWDATAPIVMWLALSLFSQPVGNSTGWLFITQNRTNDMLRWGWIGASTAVVSFLIGLPWGALGVATAYSVIGVLIRTPWLLRFVTREGPISSLDIYRRAFPMSIAGIATFASVKLLRHQVAFESAAVGLTVATTLAFAVALLTLLGMPGSRAALVDIKTMVRSLKAN